MASSSGGMNRTPPGPRMNPDTQELELVTFTYAYEEFEDSHTGKAIAEELDVPLEWEPHRPRQRLRRRRRVGRLERLRARAPLRKRTS